MVILAVVLIGFPLLVLSDTDISTADMDILDNDAAGNISERGNAWASATITIAMYTWDGE